MSRSVWIKKDVYPLMGAVGLALGIAGYATYMQVRGEAWRSQQVAWHVARTDPMETGHSQP